ncbi:MAG: hypothetical protein AAGI08_02805 [Bacteroidota bacterium]
MNPEVLFLNAVVGVALWLTVCWLTASVSHRTPQLESWGPALQGIALAWALFGVFRCDLDEIPDSITHFEGAKYVASLLADHDYGEYWRQLGGGNQGYQFMLGTGLWMFPASSRLINMLTACVGFYATLLLLEHCCSYRNNRPAPSWLVACTVTLPTFLWWSCNINKESWVLLGIVLMQRAVLGVLPDKENQRFFLAGAVGLLVVGFLRPHIAMAWLFGICGSIVVTTRNLKVGVLCCVAIVGLCAAIPFWRPDVAQILSETSLLEAMNQGYEVRVGQDIGASAIQRGGQILPFATGLEVLFFRPLPQDIYNAAMWFAGIEIWAVTAWCVIGCVASRASLRPLANPPLLAALLAILALSFFFSYMPYLGYMVRQRLQAYPAIITLASLVWSQSRGWINATDASTTQRQSANREKVLRRTGAVGSHLHGA